MNEAAPAAFREAWTYANTWEAIARAIPDAEAIRQGEVSLSWRAFDAAADALAADLLAAGLKHQAKVAVYMTNRAEYLVAYFAAFKAGLAPFNVNYRYGADEVAYLLDNADAEAVIFEASLPRRGRTSPAACVPLVSLGRAAAERYGRRRPRLRDLHRR